MHVTLPDGTAIELPDGATGLDAAAGDRPAAGAGGRCRRGRRRDARPAAAAGRRRHGADPDRPRSRGARRAAPLDRARDGRGGAAPVAGHQGGDRAGDRRRLLLRLRVPRARVGRRSGADRRRDAADPQDRAPVRAHRRGRQGTSSSGGFAAEQQPYKLELVEALPEGDISLYTQDGFEDLCRGPHLQTTKPIKAFKLQSLAGAYWRGDSNNPMLTRIYGTAFFDQAGARRVPRAAGGGPEARPPPDRPRARPVPLLRVVAGVAVLAPQGDGDLERAHRRCGAQLNLARGYQEVRTPIIFNVDVWKKSGHWEAYRENMYFTEVEARRVRAEADELPRPRRSSSTMRCGATATCRCGCPSRVSCTVTSRRARCTA